MALRSFFAIDSASLTVVFSTTQSVGDPVANSSDSPDGSQYVFNEGFSTREITVDDAGGSVDTLEDDDEGNHIVTDGAGLVANGNGIESESLIQLQELIGGVPSGPVITIYVLSQNGVTGDVWGYASDTPLTPGAEYEKVGGDIAGSTDYSLLQNDWIVSVDGTAAGDAMGIGYTDAEGDQIDGADGDDDYIFGNGGDDTINAGAGDDFVDGGDGADVFDIFAGFGADTITGGEGGTDDDTLDFSGLNTGVTVSFTGDEEGTATDGTDTITFSEIENVILTSFADLVDASLDTTGIEVAAGQGADTITGGSGDDSIRGQGGDDLIFGGAGSDTLRGAAGTDTIDGGDGFDDLRGGGGADFINVDQGDIARGGSGDDFFTLVDQDTTGSGNASINIIGGEGGESSGDTLQLTSDVSFDDITFTNENDSAGGLSGSFTMADGTSVTFSQIENIICFTPGMHIRTALGDRPVETLEVGDFVATRDNGLQAIRWIGRSTVPGLGRFAPIRIEPEAMEGLRAPLLVSPQHRVLYSGYRAQLHFGESEVLMAAKHMVDGYHVRPQELVAVTYIHLMFDRHEIIYSQGLETESFYAGDVGLGALGPASREDLFDIFPKLRSDPGDHLRTARPCLRQHEARLLMPSVPTYVREVQQAQNRLANSNLPQRLAG